MLTSEMDDQLDDARRDGWAGLRDQWLNWPHWAVELHDEMLLWLDGEDLVYVEYGWGNDAPGGTTARNPIMATTLWLTVISTRFVLRVNVTKRAGETDVTSERQWWMLRRDRIAGLRTVVPQSGQGWPGLRLELRYDGLSEPIHIPGVLRLNDQGAGGRRELFLMLREDLFGTP